MTDKNLAIFNSDKAANLPSFAKESGAGAGMENVSGNDLSTPIIKVLQPTSPEIQENPELRAGMLFNSIQRTAVSELYCVSVYYDTQFSIFSKKARQFVDTANSKEEAEVVVKGLPGGAGDYEISDTRLQYCVQLAVDDKGNIKVETPFIMYMKSTMVKVSNDWNTEIMNRYGQETSRWAGIWKMATMKRSNDKGTWFVPTISFAGYIQDKKLFDELGKIHESIAGKKE